MKAADTPQTNSTVEVEPFRFEYPLTEIIVTLSAGSRTLEIGVLTVKGWAYRKPHPVDGKPDISVDVQWVLMNGTDIKKALLHFGVMDKIEAFARHKAETVTFAPKPTKDNVLQAIIDTVLSAKEYGKPWGFPTITIRLSDADHDVLYVEGLEVTPKGELIVLNGVGEGFPLHVADQRADRMIAGIYKGLEKLFPNQIKAIA